MSGHLIGCAGALDDDVRLGTSHKLALVAFADSADDRTHIAFPGYEGVQKWAMCSRARAAELIRDLVAWGYLEQHRKAHRGQRAEYVVFPGGCCDLHRLPAEEPDVDVEDLARRAGVSVDQARQLLAAMVSGGDVVQPEADEASSTEKGSDAPDSIGGNESEPSDPNPAVVHNDASAAVETPGKGPERVQRSRSNANAFTPSKTNSPLPPPASRQGRCPAHPDGHANCRGCGTTPRQRAKAAKKRADEERRQSAIATAAAERSKPRGRQAEAEAARVAARTAIAATRQRAQEATR